MSTDAEGADRTTPGGADDDTGVGDLGDLGYVEAVVELDAILDALDRETVDVDDLARQVRRAAALIRHCRSRIAGARLEVERVVVELDELAADPTAVGRPDADEE